MKITHASALTNAQLTAEVTRLARGEREATVALIVHLAEFGERRLHTAAGFTSLFEYCTQVLHLSEDAAFNRVEASRARALTALLEDLARKKFAATKRPRKSRGQKGDSRNVPAAVQRTVWVRDLGRCAFVAPDGHRCGARRFVEFHHVDPYGAGGKPTVATIQLRCGAHNRYEAEVFYGPGKRHDGVDIVREGTAVPGWAAEQPVMTNPILRSGTVAITASRQVRQPSGATLGQQFSRIAGLRSD